MGEHISELDVKEIDRFLLANKTLADHPTPWGDADSGGFYKSEWLVELYAGATPRETKVTFVHKPFHSTTIRLIYKGRPVYGFDLDRPGEVHHNPPYAARLNLPAYVDGPHLHCWEDNRDKILKFGVHNLLQCRRSPPASGVDFASAFKVFSELTRFQLTPMQLSLELPRTLF